MLKSMTRTKFIELYENLAAMVDEKLRQFVAREVKHMRIIYSETHGGLSQEKFADKVGIAWKTISNIEKGEQVPGVDTLNQIVTACDSNLAEFFSNVITRTELASIKLTDKDETRWIESLIRGLSNPKTRRIVQNSAESVSEFLALLEAQ
jgi:transcriptional regulator with XRE-family HTH domain